MASTDEPIIDRVASAIEKTLAQVDGSWERLIRRRENEGDTTFHGGILSYQMVRDRIELITPGLMDSLPHDWAKVRDINTKRRILPLPPLDEEKHVFPFMTMRWRLDPDGAQEPKQAIHFCLVQGCEIDGAAQFNASSIHFDSANISDNNGTEHWCFPHVQVGNRMPSVVNSLDVDVWHWPQSRLPRVPLPCGNNPMQLLLTGLMSLYGTKIGSWDLSHAPHGVKDFAQELLARAA